MKEMKWKWKENNEEIMKVIIMIMNMKWNENNNEEWNNDNE